MNDDPRLGFFNEKNLVQKNMTDIFCWNDDEGIRLNKGRIGAALGPQVILHYLMKMTPSVNLVNNPLFKIHLNSIDHSLSLKQRHEQAQRLIQDSLRLDNFPLSLGGGHDYGFPDAAAFTEHFLAQKIRPTIINFDAHLDVRPADKELGSGTPFRRLLEAFHKEITFIEVGLQPHCNSRTHYHWAQKYGAKLIMASEAQTQAQMHNQLLPLLKKNSPCWVSLDIDVISSKSAPGCSQSWDNGLDSQVIFEAFKLIDANTNWRGLGIYEVSPPLDIQNMTSKLAALFAFEFISRRSQLNAVT
jgi:formiminoglutamase